MTDLTISGSRGDQSASREIRVFISSTFRDFNEERYLLATQVFPELNQRANERGVELVEVDLRWGVTQEEVEVGHALDICLQEIERCKPYFIGMLGDSYGTLTPTRREIQNISPEILKRRKWLQERLGESSYTELEIEHSLELLSDQTTEGRAFFYFRDSSYSKTKADKGEEGWISKDPEDCRRLEDLKSKIRRSGHSVAERLKTPEAIAIQIKKDLWALIEKQFPAGTGLDPVMKEDLMHRAYGDDRRKLYLGGQAMFAKLEKAICDNQGLILVTGDSGFGKSALVANWQMQHQAAAKSDLIFCHHLGCGNEAGEEANVVKRFLHFSTEFLSRKGLITKESIEAMPSDWWESVSLVNQRLKQLSEAAINHDFRFIWIIDSLDRLAEDSQNSLPWIPTTPPQNTHIVVASLQCKALRVLFERKYRRIRIEELTSEERERIVDNYLRRYSRSLDRKLKAKILDHFLAHSPLFLRVLLDELRKVGNFDNLDSQLSDYLQSDSVPKLYEMILKRLESDYSKCNVKAILTAIWASRTGLSEADLLDSTQVAPLKLLGIRLSLGDSLINSAGRLVFAHDYLKHAIESRYLKSEPDKRAAHESLFNWQDKKTLWDKRKVEELPWHAVRAGKKEEITSLLLDVEILSKLIESWGIHGVYTLLVESAQFNHWELDKKLAAPLLTYLQSDKSHGISHCLRTADLISDLLEEAGLYKDLFLGLRKYAFKNSRLEGLGRESLRMKRFKRLMNAYCLAGMYKAYQRMARLDYSIQCSKNGHEAPSSIESLVNLINSNFLCANYTEVLKDLSAWLPKAKKIFGDTHPTFLSLISTYGKMYAALGEYPKATALLWYAVEGFHQCHGPNHWQTVDQLLTLGRFVKSSEIIRDCIARLIGSYPEHHPYIIRARSILCSVSGETYELHSLASLLAKAEAVAGIGHPLELELKNMHSALDSVDIINLSDKTARAFGINSIISMKSFRKQVKMGDLATIEQRYNDYVNAGLPRIDWFLLEACSEEVLWLDSLNQVTKAYSCLASNLDLCFSCLTTEQSTTPLRFLRSLELDITTSLCKVPSIGLLSNALERQYVSRTHQAAYTLLSIFTNLTPQGVNIYAPDFHSITSLFGNYYWRPESMPWSGAYSRTTWFSNSRYHNRSWWEMTAITGYGGILDYEVKKRDGLSDLEIVADALLERRLDDKSADDFLIGQALTLCAEIQRYLGNRDTSVLLQRQAVRSREQYIDILNGDPLIGLAIVAAKSNINTLFLRHLIFARQSIPASNWLLLESKLQLAKTLISAGMHSQASSILLDVRSSLKGSLEDFSTLADTYLMEEAERMLASIEVDPTLRSIYWCEY